MLSLTLAFASGLAAAHGDEHPKAKPFDPSTVEQKAFGRAGDPAKASRTVRIAMSDKMRFTPDVVRVRRGETVRFVVRNEGRLLHELVLGTERELAEHAEMMRKFPGMEHDEPHMVHVRPGGSGEFAWTFDRPGEFRFACLVAGHYEAGMTGKVIVK